MRFTSLVPILLSVVVFVTSGCASRDLKPPRELKLKLSESVAKDILSRLGKCDEKIHSFRGLARAALVQGEEQSAFRYAVVFSKPDKLRLEAFPLSAVYTLSLLVTSKQELIFLDPSSKTAHQGAVETPVLNRFLGVPVLPPDLMSLITACMPLQSVSPENMEVYQDFKSDVVQVRGRRIVFELKAGTFEAQRAFLMSAFDDKVALLVEWSEYREVQGERLPATMKITIPARSVSLTLNFSKTEINGNYSERLFEASVPDDFELR